MLKLKKRSVFFLSGGVGYGVIELLWRGRTHWTMVLAGGVCFLMFSDITRRFQNRPIALKALLGSLGITSVELLIGIVCNLILKMNVWDYSMMPFNFLGQICLSFSLVWCGFGFLFIPIADRINKMFET